MLAWWGGGDFPGIQVQVVVVKTRKQSSPGRIENLRACFGLEPVPKFDDCVVRDANVAAVAAAAVLFYAHRKRAAPKRRVALLGDAFVDVQVAGLQERPAWGRDVTCDAVALLPGGSCANTARHLASLGADLLKVGGGEPQRLLEEIVVGHPVERPTVVDR